MKVTVGLFVLGLLKPAAAWQSDRCFVMLSWLSEPENKTVFVSAERQLQLPYEHRPTCTLAELESSSWVVWCGTIDKCIESTRLDPNHLLIC